MNNELYFSLTDSADAGMIAGMLCRSDLSALAEKKPRKKKRILRFAAASAAVIAAAGVGWLLYQPDPAKLRPRYMSCCWAYNVNDPCETAGLSDYVFVGRVESRGDTVYRGGSEMPNTVYTVTVQQELKGELPKDSPVTMLKTGGVGRLKTDCSLFEGDIMPETGGTYLILARVTDDGLLLASAPNTVIPFTPELIPLYEDAVAHPVRDEAMQQLWESCNHVYGQKKTTE